MFLCLNLNNVGYFIWVSLLSFSILVTDLQCQKLQRLSVWGGEFQSCQTAAKIKMPYWIRTLTFHTTPCFLAFCFFVCWVSTRCRLRYIVGHIPLHVPSFSQASPRRIKQCFPLGFICSLWIPSQIPRQYYIGRLQICFLSLIVNYDRDYLIHLIISNVLPSTW